MFPYISLNKRLGSYLKGVDVNGQVTNIADLNSSLFQSLYQNQNIVNITDY